MKNTDIHVVNAFTNGNFEVLDTYSLGHYAPDDDSSLGGTYDLKEVKKENDLGEFIEISYKRSLNTNDKYDFELKTVKRFLLKKFFP